MDRLRRAGDVGRRVINKAFLQTYSILGILAFTFFPIFESSNIQDQTDDRVMRVEFSQQSAKSSGTVTRARPPSASTPTTSNRDVTQGPSTFSRSSRASGVAEGPVCRHRSERDRKSTRLNSSHVAISYAFFC